MPFKPLVTEAEQTGVFRAGPGNFKPQEAQPAQTDEQTSDNNQGFFSKIGSSITDVAKGAAKGVLSTVKGASELGNKLFPVSKAMGFGAGEESAGKVQSQVEQNLGISQGSLTTPTNKSQEVGKFLEQAAEFFVPGKAGIKLASIGKGSKLAKVGLAALGEGAAAGGVTSVQTGGDSNAAFDSAIVGAAIPIGAPLMKVPFKVLTEKLPQSLVRAAVGQSKKELLAGKDVSNYVLKNKLIGTADSLIKGSSDNVLTLNKSIAQNLKSVGVSQSKITNKSIFDTVASKLNEAGGQITPAEVKAIVNQLAPQAKGLLAKPSMSLVTGNSLRQSIDRTLGDKAFLGGQLPFNKDVLMKFNSILREEVKSKAPEGTRGLFDNLSKEITLRDSLLNKYTNSKSPVTLVDAMAALVGSVGGVPGAIAGYTAKKALNSPLTQTMTATVLNQLGETGAKLAPVLEKLAPAEKALILEALQSKN